jgi:hypothetical protein
VFAGILGGTEGVTGSVSSEGQENEKGKEVAKLDTSPGGGMSVPAVGSSLAVAVFESSTPSFSSSLCCCGSADTDRDDTLVFRREYPPSAREVALGTLHPLRRPFILPTLPIVVVGLPISVTVLLKFPLDMALKGIFLFFLFFRLKSSLPTLDAVDPASSASSSESDESNSPGGCT